MARHRHTVNVRTDGLEAVLGPLLRDRRVRSAVLVDVDSGMLLDGWSSDLVRPDLEMLGAGHAELVRALGGTADGPDQGCELVVSHGEGRHHVLRTVPDPHGDRLALAVVVVGGRRVLERARRRLRVVSAPALTAGPTVSRRPGPAGWLLPVAPARRPGSAAGPVAVRTAPPVAVSAVPPVAVSAVRPVAVSAVYRAPASAAASVGRADSALLRLGGAGAREGAGAMAALPVLSPAPRRPGPPVPRAVPPPLPAPLFAAPPPVGREEEERPRAPLSALAPGPRREERAAER